MRINSNNILRGISYLERNGIKNSIYKVLERLDRDKDESDYTQEFLAQRLDEASLEAQRKTIFSNEYKISILVPLYETDADLLVQTLESVAKQTYGNWELCIADASKDDSRRSLIRNFKQKWSMRCNDRFGTIQDKVRYLYLHENKGISGNTNEALNMASGNYVALLDHDDLLEPDCLFEFIKEVNRREELALSNQEEYARVLVAYTDEDKISSDNARYFDKHVKPDFDPVLLCTNNYICHFTIVDANIAKSVSGFRTRYDGAQDHDFILRCTESIERKNIAHISKVLYHWRSTDSSTAENPNAKLYAYDSGKRAVADHLKRININAVVTDTPHLGFYRVDFDCIEDKITRASKEEIDKMTEQEINDITSEYILIVSENLTSKDEEIEKRMLSCMRYPQIGAVTGKIIGQDGRVESAGYDKIGDGLLKARFEGLNRHYSGYLHRANLEQLVGGFSPDLVLIKKSAVASFKPTITLKSGFDVFYNPYVIYKRRRK